jgi:hypothetical protein
MELTLTIEPQPASTMCGMQCLAINIMDFTFTRMPRSHSSGSTSTAVPGGPSTPTLFTSTSTPPKRPTVAATASAHERGSETSQTTTADTPPSAARSS